jgi:hypothetical protein
MAMAAERNALHTLILAFKFALSISSGGFTHA